VSEFLRQPAQNWNFSVGGTSADFVARILLSARHVIEPAMLEQSGLPAPRSR